MYKYQSRSYSCPKFFGLKRRAKSFTWQTWKKIKTCLVDGSLQRIVWLIDFLIGTQYRKVELSNKILDPHIIFKHPVFNRKSYVRRIVATSTILYGLNIADASAQNVGTLIDWRWWLKASFLFRIAPGPNSALTLRLTLGKMDVHVVFYSGLRLAQTVLYLEAYPGLLKTCRSKGLKL